MDRADRSASAPPRLLLFTRFPEPGRAKTRLIPALGEEGAAALHRRLTERTLSTLRDTGCPVEVWGTGAGLAAFQAWLGAEVALRLQGAGDLGQRMAEAIGAGPAILVGSDVPDLSGAHIQAAMAALEAGEIAIGPAEDGGYNLIALPRPAPFLFEDMVWSTDRVLRETRRRLDGRRCAYRLLPVLADLDRPEDLPRFPFPP